MPITTKSLVFGRIKLNTILQINTMRLINAFGFYSILCLTSTFWLTSTLWIISTAWPLQIAANPVKLDYIVAIVNDDVITRSELDQEIIGITQNLRNHNIPIPPKGTLEPQVLERMISNRLQLQMAERLGLQINEAILDKAVANIAAQNKLTLIQWRNKLKSEGIDFAEYREKVRQELLIRALRVKAVFNRVRITDQEVALFIQRNQGQIAGREAVRLHHILIAVPDGATPNMVQRSRNKAQQIWKKLQSGADFAQIALTNSDGQKALEGGDLGWMPISQVPTIAAKAAKTLNPGELSEPIRSASGFHIFKIAEVKGGANQVVTQTHARHILIRTNEMVSEQEAKMRLAQLRIRLIGGANFATLARSHSDDTASAIKGGDLGWINPGDTVPAFEEQMATLTENQISKPFSSPLGWHIIQVLERRQLDNTANALKQNAKENLYKRKANEALALWLRRIRDEAYIEIRLRH